MDPYSADDIERRRNNWFNPRVGFEKRFQPLTDRFEVSGTKYQIQSGTIDGEWASLLLVDNKVIRACVFRNKDLNKLGLPNFYYVNRWLMRIVVSLEANPHELFKTTKRMVEQLINLRDSDTEVKFDAFPIDPFLIDGIVWLFPKDPQIRRSSKSGFKPLSSQLGVSGTSYRVQLGFINGKWASRLLKTNDLIDSHVYKDEDLNSSGFPNQNLIIGWVLRTVAIPKIDPHQIMKTVQALTKQAITKRIDEVDDNDEEKWSRNNFDDLSKEENFKAEVIRERIAERRADRRRYFTPYPYVFKPPEPPDDIKVATNVQLNKPRAKEVPNEELFCKYCGSALAMDERFCSVCGKKA